MRTLKRTGLRALIENQVKEHGKNNREDAYDAVAEKVVTMHEEYKEGKRTNGIDLRTVPVVTMLEACLDESGFDNVDDLRNLEPLKIAEAVSSSSFTTITKFVVHSELIPRYEQSEQDLSALFTELTASNTSEERIAGFTTKAGMRLQRETEPLRRSKIDEKWAKIQIDKFSNSIALTKEAIFNDRTGQLIQEASDIGYAAGQDFEKYLIQTIEVLERTLLEGRESSASDVQAAQFDDTNVTQSNFYSSDHSSLSYMGSQTNDNLQTGALSVDALNDALILFASMKDESGKIVAVDPKVLLVSPSKALTAWEITRSTMRPDTANDVVNAFGPAGMQTFQVIKSAFVNVSTDWYLGDFKKQVVVMYWQRPVIEAAPNNYHAAFEQDIVMTWKFTNGFGAGHRDYRYVVFSDVA